jgi:SAM-dependent methyltransferase
MRMLGADAAMRRLVREVLRPEAGQRLLDVGCGPGRLTEFLPEMAYFGIDQDEQYLAEARSRYPGGRFERVDLNCGLSSFSECGFDLIVANGLIHHLSDEVAGSLVRDCFERLNSGGRLVTVDCEWQAGQHPIAGLLNKLDRGRFVRDAEGYLALARSAFERIEIYRYKNMLRVPYSHIVLECRR